MGKIPFGPSYAEMLDPGIVDAGVRARALRALSENELDAINLFNITWKDATDQVRKLVLPSALTGVAANIVVLLGCGFPSGSHKVGPAYSTLIEMLADGEIVPGEHTILSPSTGNFGIGTAYVAKLLGFDAVVIMPDNVSQERFDRIKKYGGGLELTPGDEPGLEAVLARVQEMLQDPKNKVLAQFELFPNYRFHRHVTGNSMLEAVKDVGNGRIAGIALAAGSSGTLAAGDQIKTVYPEARLAVLEPFECSTLANGRVGTHLIEGIGDQLCMLIHNVLGTDYIILVKSEETMQGLKIFQNGLASLVNLGLSREFAAGLCDCFGPSGICNVLGAIKLAKKLALGPGENVVTVATDGFDRYQSVIDKFDRRHPEATTTVLEQWIRDIFLQAEENEIYDFRPAKAKEQLFKKKEADWGRFGYTQEFFNSLRDQAFWDEQYKLVAVYDAKISAMRKTR
ncbi:MAG: pyridoxal-phosphate dependent enzyme [Heliobacteriaceae bacterium]|nr:pyridoxal-phosphate dependent enzyme [Heliobacteriaceae bacterium]MDD4586893.1 pyridoxal-phosphate dependent enzyme [Heliobacteriaceae bacterium]